MNKIISTLEDHGHEAYFVGGCVRDKIMGIPPKDYDIATSATPEQVMALFPNHLAIGAKFGVIVVDGKEVTTFRTEADHQGHDCSVKWTDLATDASRRDFTMNAMYMKPDGTIIDPFNGRKDILNGTLVTVGKAAQRFKEDPLRMLRAVRFSIKYNMSLSSEIKLAMDGRLLVSISAARIRDELLKILRLKGGLKLLSNTRLLNYLLPEIERLNGVAQDKRHPEGHVFAHTELVLCAAAWNSQRIELTDTLLMACLLHDVGKFDTQVRHPCGKTSFIDHEDSLLVEQIMLRLKFSSDQVETVVWLVQNHMRMHHFFEMKKSKRHSLMRHKDWPELLALNLYDCLGGLKSSIENDRIREYVRITEINEPTSLGDRLINGHDLLALGYKQGKEMGAVLAQLENAQRAGYFVTKEGGISWLKGLIPKGETVCQ